MTGETEREVAELLKLTNRCGQPNISDLWFALRDISLIRLNIKNFGYEIARARQVQLDELDISGEPCNHHLVSKPTTQSDIESPWFRYWCTQLKAAPIYHRKLWEFAFVLQALFEQNHLQPGMRGIGFGCGREPLAAFFASRGMDVVVTDLAPDQAVGRGWAETGQHATALEQSYYPEIVSRELFDKHVDHMFVDMNDVPEFGEEFDFCWSVCALEHLGSLAKGLQFIERSLSILKPGGTAVHTTEFNYLSEEETIDNWPTVLFLRKHFETLAAHLSTRGHKMLGPSFELGTGVLDRFVDLPPYAVGEGWLSRDQWSDPKQAAHLRLAVDGFACTCFGMIIRRAVPMP